MTDWVEFFRARDDCVRCIVVGLGLLPFLVAAAKVLKIGEEASDGELTAEALVLALSKISKLVRKTTKTIRTDIHLRLPLPFVVAPPRPFVFLASVPDVSLGLLPRTREFPAVGP